MISQSVLWQRVKNVVDSVENQVAKALLREHGIGLTDYRALKLLSDASDSELRMLELAKLLGLNQSSVTRLVERLEREGYTTRDLCPDDKRGVYTVLTDRGREMLSRAGQDYDDYLKKALDEAGAHVESRQIVQCLRKMTQDQSPTEV
ncbi:MarR family transcriptional regulator [Halomonas sabkhae]|uniref:MarR family winged helix-turn-helix transcriptional regulator n=1 Tax=Halomonas sabkhae TaxID=626223 RepID=UPI0025B4A589|nr:MarR family transcriptional regulator [Halomonas sabkhae]MDN3524654.1 MarR family transcriptional regulator [Halomonas sabkhae]